MHTRGGGVAVQFTDIEKLNHASPTKTLTRYREHTNTFLVLSVVTFRSLSQQRMDQDEYSSFSLLDQADEADQELAEDEWTDVETRVSDRECVCSQSSSLSIVCCRY